MKTLPAVLLAITCLLLGNGSALADEPPRLAVMAQSNNLTQPVLFFIQEDGHAPATFQTLPWVAITQIVEPGAVTVAVLNPASYVIHCLGGVVLEKTAVYVRLALAEGEAAICMFFVWDAGLAPAPEPEPDDVELIGVKAPAPERKPLPVWPAIDNNPDPVPTAVPSPAICSINALAPSCGPGAVCGINALAPECLTR